jgi:hypothetical protein
MRVFWRKDNRTAGALGKLPARDYGAANVTLKAVQAAPLPTAPAHFGHGKMFSDWGMLGNDTVGDCAFAGSGHEHMCWTGIGNRGSLSSRFSTVNILRSYSELTGYVPGDPSTDQGTVVSQLMDYRRTTGVLDAAGKRHKIDLAVRLPLSPNPWQTFVDAVWCFKAVAIGFSVPASAMAQFNEGKPWSYVGDWNIEGGHYVCGLGSADSASQVSVVTWGRRQVMMRDFFEQYVDELWVPLSEEAMSSIESAAEAVDWSAVESVARGLGQSDA